VPAEGKPEPRPAARKLLYPAKQSDVPVALRRHVERLLDPKQGTVDVDKAPGHDVFARVVSREYVLNGAGLKKDGTLGIHPFVFVTVPEAMYGRTLLQVFSIIGYGADEILAERSEKVLVLFRWEEKVVPSKWRDGTLPRDWPHAVYPTTWDNLFALVEKLAGHKEWHYVRKDGQPRIRDRLELASDKEALFVQGYPDAGKRRIKHSTYCALRQTKGADWAYRSLLERSMSVAEHFSGDGKTKPTIAEGGKLPKGMPEFLGPNRRLTELREVAVIGLGALRVGE
jgi:hypothetical protein